MVFFWLCNKAILKVRIPLRWTCKSVLNNDHGCLPAQYWSENQFVIILSSDVESTSFQIEGIKFQSILLNIRGWIIYITGGINAVCDFRYLGRILVFTTPTTWFKSNVDSLIHTEFQKWSRGLYNNRRERLRSPIQINTHSLKKLKVCLEIGHEFHIGSGPTARLKPRQFGRIVFWKTPDGHRPWWWGWRVWGAHFSTKREAEDDISKDYCTLGLHTLQEWAFLHGQNIQIDRGLKSIYDRVWWRGTVWDT